MMFVHALPRPWRHDLRDIGDVHVCICHSCDFSDLSPFQTPGTCGLTNVLVYVIFPSIWNTCMYSAPCFNYEWIADFAKALLFKESTLTHKYITCLIVWFKCVSLFRKKKVNLASYIPSPNLPFASNEKTTTIYGKCINYVDTHFHLFLSTSQTSLALGH